MLLAMRHDGDRCETPLVSGVGHVFGLVRDEMWIAG